MISKLISLFCSYTTLYFFLAARFYQEAFYGSNKSPFYLLCLTYLCSVLTGIYSSIMVLVTYLAATFTHNPADYLLQEKCLFLWNGLKSWFFLHIKLVLYLSWIIIPTLISYPYLGSDVLKMRGGFLVPNVMRMFLDGDLFDYNQNYKYCTVLILCGVMLAIVRLCLHLYASDPATRYPLNADSKFALWLLSVASISIALYIENPLAYCIRHYMPFNLQFDTKSFIIGIQSCGAVFIGFVLDKFVEIVSQMPLLSRNGKKLFLTVLISLVLIKDGADRVSENVSFLEISDGFGKTLKEFRSKQSGDGRILTTTKLGIF